MRSGPTAVIARAPGKVVLAGAYAVLEGAPAWVAAVDRYVIADSAQAAELVTPEVREALRGVPGARAPWFDASALRDRATDRKLGLGSSAAILVASLAALALERDPELEPAALAHTVFERALRAHRRAQGGGSGIDVAASAFGGILRFQRAGGAGAGEGEGDPRVTARALPANLAVAVWSSPEAASTSSMLARVSALREAGDTHYRRIIARLRGAAEACDDAVTAAAWLDIAREQLAGLCELGQRARIPVVTEPMQAFQRAVSDSGAVVLPSGAGGGDVILVLSDGPPHADVEPVGRALGLMPLSLSLCAPGVHRRFQRLPS
jgi:phosphomevalonate kinase